MNFNQLFLTLLLLSATATPANAGLWSSFRNSALISALLGKTYETHGSTQSRLPVIEEKLSFWQRITNLFGWRYFRASQQAQPEQAKSSGPIPSAPIQKESSLSPAVAQLLSQKLDALRKKYEQENDQKTLATLQHFETQLNSFTGAVHTKLKTSQDKINNLAQKIDVFKKDRTVFPQLPIVAAQTGLMAPAVVAINSPALISDAHAAQSDEKGMTSGLLQSNLPSNTHSAIDDFTQLSHTPSPELLPAEQTDGTQSIYEHIQVDPVYYLTKAQKGRTYLEEINRGNFPAQLAAKNQDEHLEIIEAILYRLHQNTSYRGQAFLEGTYVIQDTQNFDFYNTLLSYIQKVNPDVTGTVKDPLAHVSLNPFAYPRDASHFVENKNKYPFYGIDLRRKDKTTFSLPNGHGHLLVCMVDYQNRIFAIKPEHKGIYIFDGWLGHCSEFLTAQARKQNVVGTSIRSIAKLFGYDIWTDDNPLYHKERIPSEFIKQFGLLLAQEEALTNEQKEQLKKEASLLGIQKLADPQIAQSPAFQQMKAAYNARYDNLEKRRGREVHVNLQQLITLEQ